MLARSPLGRSPDRRGAILLIVLTLLALFAVIALSFVLYSENEATNARTHREAADDTAPRGDLQDEMKAYDQLVLNNLVAGMLVGPTDPTSGFYGHDLARLVFASNAVATVGQFVPPIAAPQIGTYAGEGGITDARDAQAIARATGATYTPGSVQPLLIPGTGGVPRQDVVCYGPVVAPAANGFVGVYPEHTGYQQFTTANPTWTPVMANNTAYTAPAGPELVSKAAAYTYPDANNLFLAQVRPDTGELVTPSYHRPYLFDRTIVPANPQPYQYGSYAANGANRGSLDPRNPNWSTNSGRFRVVRPRPWDQLTPQEQQQVSALAGVPYPLTESMAGMTPAQQVAAQAALVGAMQQLTQGGVIPPVMPFPAPNADGSFTGDVQNYKTTGRVQRNDSVWVYPAGPLLNWRGKRIVPMVSPMVLDLSSRANLNVAANVTTFTDSYQFQDGTGYKSVRYLTSRSGVGLGPQEINLSRVLGNGVSDRQFNPGSGQGVSPGVPTTATAGPATDQWGVSGGEGRRARTAKTGYNQGGAIDRYTGGSVPLPGIPSYAPGTTDWVGSTVPAWPPSATSTNAADYPGVPAVPSAPVVGASSTFAGHTSLDVRQQVPPTGDPSQFFPRSPNVDPANRWFGVRVNAAESFLFNPAQWTRGTPANGTTPHAFGFDDLRRLAARFGLGANDRQQLAALSELAKLMPAALASGGGEVATANGFAPNPGNVARALMTTHSASTNRPELAITTNLNGTVVPGGIRLGPVDVNRRMPSYHIPVVGYNRAELLVPLPAQVGTTPPPISGYTANVYPLDGGGPGDNESYKQYARARQARQNLARDVFVRLAANARLAPKPGVDFTLSATPFASLLNAPLVDGVEVAYDPATGYLAHWNTTASPPQFEPIIPGNPTAPGAANAPNPVAPNVPAQPAPVGAPNTTFERFDALRRLAQVAANIVDYIDGDDISTTFAWNPARPLFNDQVAVNALNTPAPTDPALAYQLFRPATFTPAAQSGYGITYADPVNPAVTRYGVPHAYPPALEFIDPSANPATLPLGTVFGTELPRLVATEAYVTLEQPNGSGNYRKKIWVELTNPLPEDLDPVVSDLGAARLQYFNLGGTDPRPNYSPYRLEVYENRNPQQAFMVDRLATDQAGGNVTGLVPHSTSATPDANVIQRAAIELFADGGTSGMDEMPKLGDMGGGPLQMNDSLLVRPLGRLGRAGPAVGPAWTPGSVAAAAKGYLTVGPEKCPIDGAKPITLQFAAGTTEPLDADIGSNDPAEVATGKSLSPNVVVVRRLANPYMRPNDPSVTAGPHAFVAPYTPGGRPLNPYVTVDLMDGVPTDNKVQNPPPGTPAATNKSHARHTPYADVPPQPAGMTTDWNRTPIQAANPLLPLCGEQGANNATFFDANTVPPPAAYTGTRQWVDGSGWLVHLDRELVNPLELFHVSGFRPYELTGRFAAPFQPRTPRQPGDAGPGAAALPQWHLGAQTLASAFFGPSRPTYDGEVQRSPLPPNHPTTPPPPHGLGVGTYIPDPLSGSPPTLEATPTPTGGPAWQVAELGGVPPLLFQNPAAPLAYRMLNPDVLASEFNGFHRLLDVLAVRSRMPGVPVGGTEAGRVNPNAFWDDQDDPFVLPPDVTPGGGPVPNLVPSGVAYPNGRYSKPATSRMLKAVLDPADNLPVRDLETNLPLFTQRAVNRNGFGPTQVAYAWQPDPDLQPTNRMNRTFNFPNVSAADRPFRSPGSAASSSDTLLRERHTPTFWDRTPAPLLYDNPPPQRADGLWRHSARTALGTNPPVADPYGVEGVRPTSNLPAGYSNADHVADATTTAAARRPTRHPYAAAEPLRKGWNSLTPTSDAFLVLLTVSYFEVRDVTFQSGPVSITRGVDTTIPGAPRPLIGLEAFRDVPGDLRKQYAIVMDRSQLAVDNNPVGLGGLAFNRVFPQRPWTTMLAADANPGEVRVTVAGTTVTVGGIEKPAVLVDGELRVIEPYNFRSGAGVRPESVIRVGYGDAAAGGDGETLVVWYDGAPPDATSQYAKPAVNNGDGTVTMLVSADPRIVQAQPTDPPLLGWLTSPLPYPAAVDAAALGGAPAGPSVPRGVQRSHGASTLVGNATFGNPGPRPRFDLTDPAIKGVVPYVQEMPKP